MICSQSFMHPAINLRLESVLFSECDQDHDQDLDESCMVESLIISYIHPVEHALITGRRSLFKAMLVHSPNQINKWVANSANSGSLLHIASSQPHADIVNTLLRLGADSNVLDANNELPLHVACRLGHLAAVELLLQTTRDIDGPNKFYQLTPLHLACRAGHVEVCRALIGRGARLDSEDRLGHSPLHCATRHGHVAVVQLLLDNGASVHAIERRGYTALHLAASAETARVSLAATLLSAGAAVDAQDLDGNTALHLASENGLVDVVRTLLASGADVHLANRGGRTALHKAVALRTLSKHPSCAQCSPRGCAGARCARCVGRKATVLALLVEGRADASRGDVTRASPLHLAVQAGEADEELLRALVAEMREVDLPNRRGETALHLATGRNQAATVALLLSLGADPTRKDGRGRTARAVAVEARHVAVARVVEAAEKRLVAAGRVVEAAAVVVAAGGIRRRRESWRRRA